MVPKRKHELTDEQWARIEPLLPPQKLQTGRPARDQPRHHQWHTMARKDGYSLARIAWVLWPPGRQLLLAFTAPAPGRCITFVRAPSLDGSPQPYLA
jgi:hypothetical protein